LKGQDANFLRIGYSFTQVMKENVTLKWNLNYGSYSLIDSPVDTGQRYI